MLGGDHRQYGSPDRATAWRGANGDLRSSGNRLDLAAEAITRLDANREMERVTGIDPATSGVTGPFPNQLRYPCVLRWRRRLKSPPALSPALVPKILVTGTCLSGH